MKKQIISSSFILFSLVALEVTKWSFSRVERINDNKIWNWVFTNLCDKRGQLKIIFQLFNSLCFNWKHLENRYHFRNKISINVGWNIGSLWKIVGEIINLVKRIINDTLELFHSISFNYYLTIWYKYIIFQNSVREIDSFLVKLGLFFCSRRTFECNTGFLRNSPMSFIRFVNRFSNFLTPSK